MSKYDEGFLDGFEACKRMIRAEINREINQMHGVEGNGIDNVACRNGLILAYNIIESNK